MKIYSMTATFGKLEHETLALQPGLNIIEAPNEWGKSTWCAFLAAMLYGIETRVHSTKAALADKERYAPWSGAPMSGRIDLSWNGRDITIERRTKGRAIMGDFKAYETGSGLAVPELTAANCGQMLLGVERDVFLRAGFLKLTDLPVTNNDALRRRLNALVTTGDESGAADKLSQKLRDLKNRCRFNRSGLLPQAEAQRAEINAKLQNLHALQEQSQRIRKRQGELEEYQDQLANHRDALEYAAAQADAARVADALAAKDNTARQLAQLEAQCKTLPSREQAEQTLQEINRLHQSAMSMQMEAQMLPQPPEPVQEIAPFQGMSAESALSSAREDAEKYIRLRKAKLLPFLILLALSAVTAVVLPLLWAESFPYCLIPLGISIFLLLLRLAVYAGHIKDAKRISAKYGTGDTDIWLNLAQRHGENHSAYATALREFETARGDLEDRKVKLAQQISSITQGATVQEALEYWNNILSGHTACADACREYQRAASHAAALQAMAKPAEPPKQPDSLSFSEPETNRLLSDTGYELRRLQLQLGQCLGQMENLGQEAVLRQQLEAVNIRIAQLEDTYAALVLAQETLTAATAELQRRFAPRISQRAQELFSKLTGGRYDRLTLAEDLSLHAGAEGEDTLHTAQWRSDGTVDQLYLALRLAVAEALTPDAPLILDDALVRFDDKRLAAAMDILRECSQSKQVILFTCQGRENTL